MRYLLAVFLLIMSSLYSHSQDITSFEIKEKRQTDAFDFTGDYPNLEKIDIDGTKKYRAELLLSGHYPKLERVRYVSGFGDLKADLSGHFPLLQNVEIIAGSTKMVIDLTGKIDKICDVVLTCRASEVTLLVPKESHISLHSKLGVKGKLIVPDILQKQGRGWLEKNYATAGVIAEVTGKAASGITQGLKIHIVGDESKITVQAK